MNICIYLFAQLEYYCVCLITGAYIKIVLRVICDVRETEQRNTQCRNTSTRVLSGMFTLRLMLYMTKQMYIYVT